MNKEKYEREIANLEDRINCLEADNKMLKESRDKELAQYMTAREDYLRGLLKFLGDLYSRFGNIQQDVLAHSAKLNKVMMKTVENRNMFQFKNLEKEYLLSTSDDDEDSDENTEDA